MVWNNGRKLAYLLGTWTSRCGVVHYKGGGVQKEHSHTPLNLIINIWFIV
jgi:hypothetical protein